jgi:hypothetical protein
LPNLLSLIDQPNPNLVSEAPQSAVTGADVAAPYRQFSEAAEKAAGATNEVAVQLAHQAALKSVTRDENGKVQVSSLPLLFGDAAKEFQRVQAQSYVAQMGPEIEKKAAENRIKFEGNPAGFDEWSQTYIKELGDGQKNPDLKNAVVGLASRHLTETYNGILVRQNTRDIDRAKQAMSAQQEGLENELTALSRDGDTSSVAFKGRLADWETIQSDRLKNPLYGYSRERAAQDHENFVSKLQGNALIHTVGQIYDDKGVNPDGSPKGGYDAAYKAAQRVLTDPSLNLTQKQREDYAGRAVMELNNRARQDERIQKGVASEIGAVQDSATKGYSPAPERMGRLKSVVEATGNPELAQELHNTEVVADTMKDWRTQSPAQLESSVATIDKTMREKGETPVGRALVDAGTKLLKEMRTQVGADPLGWSDRTGVMPVPPIQFGSPEAAGQMTDRASRAEIIAQHYGIPTTYLRPDEKEALTVATAKGGPEMLGVARTIVDGFGDRAPKVMAELSKDAPTLAHVGALVSSGGNQGFAMDVADGIKLRTDPGFQIPKWMDKPEDKILYAQAARGREVYGSAFVLLPDSGRAAEQAAKQAFFTRAYRNGYDPELGAESKLPTGVKPLGVSQAAYDKTLQESVGAKFIGDAQYGGIGTYKAGGFWNTEMGKVLVPGTVRANRFQDVIGAITDEDLRTMAISPETVDGKPYTARDLRNSIPIAVNGGYVFAKGDPTSADPRYIRGALGAPFKLDFNQMEPVLRKRVPDAFLGGR